MKGSEALLRAIANEGCSIPSIQFDIWITQLIKAGLLDKEVRDDKNLFHYKLTKKAKVFLRKKGVTI